MIFVTFLLFQKKLYVVLARGKGPKIDNFRREISLIEIFSRQKTLKFFGAFVPWPPPGLSSGLTGELTAPLGPQLRFARCVRLTRLLISLQYFSVSLKFGACYITSQWDEFRIKNPFLVFFGLFHHKICVFIIFISFFEEAWNFRGRISTNQKQELVVQYF